MRYRKKSRTKKEDTPPLYLRSDVDGQIKEHFLII